MNKSVKIFIAGVGGQGSLTLSRLLGEAALIDGKNPVVSEVHGMSQRGGVVESTVLIGDYKSPLIRQGDADLLVSFEPAEALRAAGFISRKTVVVVNRRKTVPFSVSLGMGIYPEEDVIFQRLKEISRSVFLFDAQALAEQAGSAMATNVVFMGALTATGLLPMSKEAMMRTVIEKTPARFREANLKAFALGLQAVSPVH
jgi:indolepyruvate ferredoxin oxidoreductase, beta subunit